MDLFQGIRDAIDFRTNARIEYETRVASRDTVLDVGGHNQHSTSNRRLRQVSANPNTKIVSTDILPHYQPDIVDDICHSTIATESYDAVYCEAVLEHVEDYEAAMRHIHRILKPGGEVFIYVPFFFCFHDEMDHHRFTFTEVHRMLRGFRERKVCLSDGNGYGGVLWQVLTFYQIQYFPRLWGVLSKIANGALTLLLWLKYKAKPDRNVPFRDYRAFYVHFYVNHGFCGWAVK